MIVTVLASENEVKVTTPDGHSDIAFSLGNVADFERKGRIVPCNGSYSVEFMDIYLESYNKSGFNTRIEAVEYEQRVLDENLASTMH